MLKRITTSVIRSVWDASPSSPLHMPLPPNPEMWQTSGPAREGAQLPLAISNSTIRCIPPRGPVTCRAQLRLRPLTMQSTLLVHSPRSTSIYTDPALRVHAKYQHRLFIALIQNLIPPLTSLASFRAATSRLACLCRPPKQSFIHLLFSSSLLPRLTLTLIILLVLFLSRLRTP